MVKPRLNPRKTPCQSRSAVTVATILEAAAHILEREGLEGYNTNAVALRAGVSIGSLYQYFPNKDSLMVALIAQHQNHRADQLAGFVQHLSDLPLEEGLAAIINAAVQGEQHRPMLSACLDHEERRLAVDGVIEQAGLRIDTVVAKYLRTFAPQKSLASSMRMARTLRLAVRAIVDDGLNRSSPKAAVVAAEALAVAKGYLSQLIDQARRPRPVGSISAAARGRARSDTLQRS
jgi:AcrR family transcriptional regulator